MIKNFWLFQKNSKIFLWTRRMQFWRICQKNFARRPETLSSMSENVNKYKVSQENTLSSKCFTWTVECSYQSRAGRNSKSGRNFFVQCPKVMKKAFLQENFIYWKYPYGYVECNFYNPVESFWQKTKVFCSLSEIEKNGQISHLKVFLSLKGFSGQEGWRLNNSTAVFLPQDWKFFYQCAKVIKKFLWFFQKTLKIILRRNRMQFWRLRWRTFDKKQKLLIEYPTRTKKLGLIRKKVSPRYSSRLLECSFENPVGKNLT